MPRLVRTLTGLVMAAALAPIAAEAQDWTRREFPLAPPNAEGNFVAPYFDGFYRNPDGTYTLSFGFMNRNDSDLIEIPLGENNFIEPAQYQGVQPTSFPTVSYGGFGGPRERGAFAVVVPADYEGEVVWTLTTDGYTTKVPGRIRGGRFQGLIGFEAAYELSTTPQAEGSLRPSLRFTENGPDGIGLVGIQHPQQFTTRVGQPIEVRLWAFDRGERDLKDVNMTLWKYQGPVGAQIAFESLTGVIQPMGGRGGIGQLPGAAAAGGRAGRGGRPAPTGPVAVGQSVRLPIEGPDANMGRFRATFDTPGEYVIRVRIDNFTTGDSAPGNQCCWSNGYVRVNVTN